MISFRHHIVTLVAVFLALAVGIVLGGGPFSEVARTTAADPDPAVDATAQARAAYGDGFAAAVAPRLYSDRLAQQRVALVTLPGADESTVSALKEHVTEAGGSFTGRYSLTAAMLDAEQKSLVDTLGSQLMTQGREDQVSSGATTYDRIGELLGDAVAVRKAGAGPALGSKDTGVVDGLVGAELLATDGAVETKAPLVLVVLGKDRAGEGADTILSGLVTGLSRAALGVVVAGRTDAGGEGQLGRLRDATAEEVTTVDGVESTAGQVTTTLALARAVQTRGGSFGASGADGPVPLG